MDPTTTTGGEPRDRSLDAPQAVVLAGGKGVRLRPYTTLLPQPLVPLGDEQSVLEVVLRQLSDQGFSTAHLAIGTLGQLVRAFIGDGSQWGIDVVFVPEDAPPGTIRPILRILDNLPEHFVVVHGDCLTNLDFHELLVHHLGSGRPLTVATYQREHRVEPGALEMPGQRFDNFAELSVISCSVSMGVYAVSREALRPYGAGLPMNFDELMLDLIERGTPPSTYRFDGYWLDIGRPEDTDDHVAIPVAEHHTRPA
ncbi:MAG TPA: nucleotidyltransferase family protein [Acidimicrobiales bacterium]|jgi:mannose-1-phosphate guanylyltransferase